MAQVKTDDSVVLKLVELVFVLVDKGYFTYFENAIPYVQGIRNFINELPSHRKRTTKNNRYGQYYCTYKPNKRTLYYITFDIEDDFYLVKNIFTNHTKDYPFYIENVK